MKAVAQGMERRQEIFDLYWHFAAWRQEVFFRRIKNDLPPWTEDRILRTYKFCNAYRASDRVSQYLIRDVIYKDSRSQKEEEVLFRILLFKIFNKIETWEYLESKLGTQIELSSFKFEVYSNLLQEARDRRQVIYTSAYMSCATKAYGYHKKHENHLALIEEMLEDRLVDKMTQAKSLEEVFQAIAKYRLLGKFMAYQLATDINYSNIIDFEEDSFTVAGPGAERGISKCFIDRCGKSNAEIIHWMTDNQEAEFSRLGINFQSLWGRPLKAIDCQNLFCEVDKYCRVAHPELTSNRTRIKAKFSPTPQPIEYFYPPKWGINDKVRETLAQRLPVAELSEQSVGLQGEKKKGRKGKEPVERSGQKSGKSNSSKSGGRKRKKTEGRTAKG